MVVHSGRREEEEENVQSKWLLVLPARVCLFSLEAFWKEGLAVSLGAAEMAQAVKNECWAYREHTVIRQFTTECNSSSRGI